MPRSPILITGANGFVGSHLLRRIQPGEFARVVATCRQRSRLRPDQLDLPGVEWIECEFPRQRIPEAAFQGIQTVIHLAAITGKAAPATYFLANAAGTRSLLEQCTSCGVRQFLFVSTIAAKFKDVSRYYYARSKQEAEEAVRTSGLRYLIVRPTIILGREGGAWKALEKLARLPVMPIFGSGKALIQPIAVEDLSEILLNVVREDRFTQETLELGGPETISIEDFLRKVRQLTGRPLRRVVHLPLGLIRSTLSLVENALLPLLPFTAGQLSTFAEDGVASRHELFSQMESTMQGLDAMLQRLLGVHHEARHEPTRT